MHRSLAAGKLSKALGVPVSKTEPLDFFFQNKYRFFGITLK